MAGECRSAQFPKTAMLFHTTTIWAPRQEGKDTHEKCFGTTEYEIGIVLRHEARHSGVSAEILEGFFERLVIPAERTSVALKLCPRGQCRVLCCPKVSGTIWL